MSAPLQPLLDAAAYLSFPARLMLRPARRRYVGPWLASLAPGYLLRRGLPWVTFDAIAHLDGLDLRGRRVFEYGSGGSTLYWLRRGASLVSVEHDPRWHARVAALLPAGAPVDYRLVEPEPAPPGPLDPADPGACRSAAAGYAGLAFRRYAEQIAAFPDGHFDLVLVDGRARPACLARAAPKVRPGGALVLDNAERAYYTARLGAVLQEFDALAFPGPVPRVPVVSRTTFYTRRGGSDDGK
jgi:hypothetical protein